MEWFKHDTNAANDAKIKKLLIRHGAVGYAVYFHCLELIAGNVSRTNITFELEHDAEIIADDLRIRGDGSRSGADIVSEIMRTIVSLGLFEEDGGRIFCLKLLRRLDCSMTSSPQLRQMIQDAKEAPRKNRDRDSVMTAPDNIMLEENRLDEIRGEEREKTREAGGRMTRAENPAPSETPSISEGLIAGRVFNVLRLAGLPPCDMAFSEFVATDFREALGSFRASFPERAIEDLVTATENYVKVLNEDGSWFRARYRLGELVTCRRFRDFLPGRFDMSLFVDGGGRGKAPPETKNIKPVICRVCGFESAYYDGKTKTYLCTGCGARKTAKEWDGMVLEKLGYA